MARLHLPRAYITLIVKDRNGKTIYRKRMASKSWVGNIMGLISALLGGVTTGTSSVTVYCGTTRVDLVDVYGNSRGINLCFGSSSATVVSSLIVVGSGDTPVSLSDYKIVSEITSGSGSGQLVYGSVQVTSLSRGDVWSVSISRTFTNLSGAPVTVKEVGLFIRLPISTSTIVSFMFARDVIPGGITVPNGGVLTVIYTIQYSLQ